MRTVLDTSGSEGQTLHPGVVAVNAAVAAFVDDLLRMPSREAAATVVDLLYGRDLDGVPAVLTHVNGGMHIALEPLLTSPRPLVVLLTPRLRVSSAWRKEDQAVKGARAAARARYRELQSAFVAKGRGAAAEASASLLRYTYGCEGRHWPWEETAARLLHRVTTLNRAVLGLLAALARERASMELPMAGARLVLEEYDLPPAVLDLMAAALPPVAVPDWPRFAVALHDSIAPLGGEESLTRYRSLLAEILGLTAVNGETSA
jgi:hypothetical protein